METTALYPDCDHRCEFVGITRSKQVSSGAGMHDDLGYDRIVRCNPERMPGVDRNRLGWIVDLIENADFERGIGLKKSAAIASSN